MINILRKIGLLMDIKLIIKKLKQEAVLLARQTKSLLALKRKLSYFSKLSKELYEITIMIMK